MISKKIVFGIAMSLAWPLTSSAAVIVELKTQHNLDFEGIEQASEFLRVSATDPNGAELIFNKLKRRGGYGPEFVDGVMSLVLERTHNIGGYEAKTRLMAALPELIHVSRMHDLWKTALGEEIKQKINRLRFSGRGDMVKFLSKAFSLYDASDWRWIGEKLAAGDTATYLPALMNVPVDQVPFRYSNQIFRFLSSQPNPLNLALLYHLAPNRVDMIALVRQIFAEYKNSGDLGRMNFPLHLADNAEARDLYARVIWDIEKSLLEKDQPTLSACELARAMEMKKEDPRLVSGFFDRLYSGQFSRPVEIRTTEFAIPSHGEVVHLDQWRGQRCAKSLHRQDD